MLLGREPSWRRTATFATWETDLKFNVVFPDRGGVSFIFCVASVVLWIYIVQSTSTSLEDNDGCPE